MATSPSPSGNNYSNVPVPDPSVLTTEQLRRELAALRDSLETRLAAMDKAAELLNENVTRVPTETDKQISHLKELHDEKFLSVTRQFHERDVRTEGDKSSASTAINAALAALKEMIGLQNSANATAIGKSESATAKELESLNKIITSTKDAIASDIRNLASRLDRGEGGDKANSSNQTTMFAVAALVVSILVGGFSIISGMRKDPPVPSAVAVVPVNPR